MSVESVGGSSRVVGVEGVARAAGTALEQVSSTRVAVASPTSSNVSLADLGRYVDLVQNQQTVQPERLAELKAAVIQGTYGAMLERLAEKLAGLDGA